MNLSTRIFLHFFWLILMVVCALLLFTKGFLLKRIVVSNSSSCETSNIPMSSLWNQRHIHLDADHEVPVKTCDRVVKPKFKKALMIVIDGMRYDFMQWNDSLLSTAALPFQNKMKKLKQLMERHPQRGKLYKFEADPPTTTMQRIKGLTTGNQF